MSYVKFFLLNKKCILYYNVKENHAIYYAIYLLFDL